jgi:hypothetical protein
MTDILETFKQFDNNVIQQLTDRYPLVFSQERILTLIKKIVLNPALSNAEKIHKLKNIWTEVYVYEPPSIEEFLTPKWIGATADKIYPHVKEVMQEFLNPASGRRVLALSTCIGWGKSSLTTLIAIYIVVHLCYMKDPKASFNLSAMGSIVIALMSFTQQKVNQVLLQPFANLLRDSPMFERVRQEERLEPKQKELEKKGEGKIAYTSAGRMGSFQFIKDIHITISSDRASLLGLNIILGIVSEISFWIKKGISVNEIWGAFSDMRERVNSRFAHKYLSGVILDSSPLDLSLSPIDKWIYEGDARDDPEVMVVNAKHWEVFPEKYPKWLHTGETIPVFRGDGSRPPKVLYRNEINEYRPGEVYYFPIDTEQSLKNTFELKKIVADLAGWPAGGLAKLIEDSTVLESMFTDSLNNIYTSITAPEEQEPEKLIWNKVRDIFFIQVGKRYEFYRAPLAPRTLHIDLAESGDMASLAMNHLEIDKRTGDNVIVNDFTIAISPEASRINIDAVCNFIIDLKRLGSINFYKITADQYQSSALLQRLKRSNLEVDKLSVDRDNTPYRVVLSWILNEKVKCGKNIFLKNNLLSLVETKNDKNDKIKIDHTKGQLVYTDHGDWRTSQMGIHAKDVSDAFTGSAYVLITELDSKVPRYTWKEAASEEEKMQDIMDELMDRFTVKIN